MSNGSGNLFNAYDQPEWMRISEAVTKLVNADVNVFGPTGVVYWKVDEIGQRVAYTHEALFIRALRADPQRTLKAVSDAIRKAHPLNEVV